MKLFTFSLLYLFICGSIMAQDKFPFDDILSEAIDAYLAGEYQLTIKTSNKLIKLEPEFCSGYSMRGYAYLSLSQYENALNDFNKAVELDPSASVYKDRGYYHSAMGETELAIQDFSMSIMIDSLFFQAYVNRGSSYLELGENEKALIDLTKAIELQPKNGRAYYFMGKLFYSNKEYQKALPFFNKAIQLEPGHIYSYPIRGKIWIYEEEYAKSIKDYLFYIKNSPKDIDVFYPYIIVGMNQVLLKQHNSAISQFSLALTVLQEYDEVENSELIPIKEYTKKLIDVLQKHKQHIEEVKELDTILNSLLVIAIKNDLLEEAKVLSEIALKINNNSLMSKYYKALTLVSDSPKYAQELFNEIQNDPQKSDFKIYAAISQAVLYIASNEFDLVDLENIESMLTEIKDIGMFEKYLDEIYAGQKYYANDKVQTNLFFKIMSLAQNSIEK